MVKRGSDVRYFRTHLSIVWAGTPAIVLPVIDLGLCIIANALGATKTIWGPYSIKANITDKEDNPAVILIGSDRGPLNSMVCSDPCDFPALFSSQSPSTVKAGMTVGDILGNILATAADLGISALLKFGIGKLFKLPKVDSLLGSIGMASIKGLDGLATRISSTAFRSMGEFAVRTLAKEFVEDGAPTSVITKLLTDTLDKGLGDMVKDGNLLPFENFTPFDTKPWDAGVMKVFEDIAEDIGQGVDKDPSAWLTPGWIWK